MKAIDFSNTLKIMREKINDSPITSGQQRPAMADHSFITKIRRMEVDKDKINEFRELMKHISLLYDDIEYNKYTSLAEEFWGVPFLLAFYGMKNFKFFSNDEIMFIEESCLEMFEILTKLQNKKQAPKP